MSPASAQALGLLAFCVPAEAARELAYKRATDEAGAAGGLWPHILARPLLWVGLALWAVELVAWVMVLQRLPLEVAFPLMALSYAAIPLAAHWWLRERLDRRQWAGVALITCGCALVGAAGV